MIKNRKKKQHSNIPIPKTVAAAAASKIFFVLLDDEDMLFVFGCLFDLVFVFQLLMVGSFDEESNQFKNAKFFSIQKMTIMELSCSVQQNRNSLFIE